MRYSSLVAAAGLLASGVALGQPAQATAPSAPEAVARPCTIYPPKGVAIGQPQRDIPVRIGSDCKPVSKPAIYASWGAIHPSGRYDTLTYGPDVSSMAWTIFDGVTPLGQTTWQPGGAHDEDYVEYDQNTPTTIIKVAAWSGVTVSRSGSKATVTASVARYASTVNRLVPWAKAATHIQSKSPSSTRWTALKSGYTNAGGKLGITFTPSAVRDYRVVVVQTNVIWGATSKTVRR